MKPDDELEAVFRKWADESKYEDLRREWEEEQRDTDEPFRTICGIAALIMIVVWLVGCQTPPRTVASVKPQIPKDVRLVCHKPTGQWAVISESSGEAALFNEPCGNNSI